MTSDEWRVTNGAVANAARKTDEAVARLARLEKTAEGVLGLDDLEATMDALNELRDQKHADPKKQSEECRKEIAWLLEHVGKSGLEFIHNDDRRSAAYFSTHLWIKQQFFKKTVGSAEDFIANVATQSLSGHTYQVIEKDGAKTELRVWLMRALEAQRKAKGAN